MLEKMFFVALGSCVLVTILGANFVWTKPAANVDGTPYDDHDHYNVKFYDESSGGYPNAHIVGQPTTEVYPVPNVTKDTLAVVTAVDKDGNESGPSNPVQLCSNCPVCPPDLTADVNKWRSAYTVQEQFTISWQAKHETCTKELIACNNRK